MFSFPCGSETVANVLRDIEDILDLRSIIGQSLEHAGKGVREEKGDDELDCSEYQTLLMLRSTVDLRSSVEAPRALARYSKATLKSIWALEIGTIGRLTSVDVGQHRELVDHRWFLGRYSMVFHFIVLWWNNLPVAIALLHCVVGEQFSRCRLPTRARRND